MSSDYPQIPALPFTRGCETARTKITEFFSTFHTSLAMNPDERGLTDQLLYYLIKEVPKINVDRSPATVEATKGYDYSWKFSARNPTTSMMQNRWLLFQAKNYKPGRFGGSDINVADFTYSNSNGLQMTLLDTYISATARANRNVVVTGGYIVYGTTTIQFIPIADVIAEYDYQLRNGHSASDKTALNRIMSKTFLDRGEAHYNIQNILTYNPM